MDMFIVYIEIKKVLKINKNFLIYILYNDYSKEEKIITFNMISKDGRKQAMFQLTEESYNIIGRASKEVGIRKSLFVDFIVKKYGDKFISDLKSKVERVGI
jgi:hypothetical protein